MKKIYCLLSMILFAKAHEQIISQINFAIANNNSDQFTKLLSLKANINLCTRDITPPLFNAIFFGNYEFTKILLEHGANVNLQDHCGTTPLHCAVRAVAGNKEQIIKLLLERGADLKIKNNLGKLPTDCKPLLVRKFATVSLTKQD
jgi:ankyrin repeat protein